jgi:hypothetical protein
VANPCTEDSSTVHALLPELPEDELLDELPPLEPELLDDELEELLDVVEELVELEELPPEEDPSSGSLPSPLPPHPLNKMAITASAVSLQKYIVLSGRHAQPGTLAVHVYNINGSPRPVPCRDENHI